MTGDLEKLGWQVFEHDPALMDWVRNVAPVALSKAGDPKAQADWLRHGGTWFVGVNLLDNDETGAVSGSGPLRGAAIARAQSWAGPAALDRAQISICHPGYPGRDPGETDSSHRFRRDRDAAHLDGLLGEGTPRRRFFREYHAFILGVPLTEADPQSSPLVVWDGSHHILCAFLREALGHLPPEAWGDVDVTQAYAAARRQVFETCTRRELPVGPGEATLLHRFALHGVAPWRGGTEARAIAYFRPMITPDREFLGEP